MRNLQQHRQAPYCIILQFNEQVPLFANFCYKFIDPGRMKGLVGLSNCELITYSRSTEWHCQDLSLQSTDPETDTLTTQPPTQPPMLTRNICATKLKYNTLLLVGHS